ncbi:hypothetical protein CB0940_07214 [Cercospora beticola]|uniref:Uncharacterized protein n=1 Tax=Cercospora beticola TaxID=122368 RepID=A0A2G5HAG7_CERBT|nr:hypothetical protein CB0940_07214 [Cercospora beticola]PIA89524.1 hypothetical protein CB0940_07214 [Cercospora beticola]WPB03144.1 hypothetical protein RHO25_007781 [Cercospora beticola]CAK1358143.1 unnamed protein product [Cercospora beticola]
MRASILASAATLLVATQARIVGFYAPNTAAPGTKVRLEIQTENFSQSIEDVAMSFGLTTGNGATLGSLGQLISTKILGADLSNTLENITHIIEIPADATPGPAIIQGAHFSLTGAVYSPLVEVYYANITIGQGNNFPLVQSARIPQVDN